MDNKFLYESFKRLVRGKEWETFTQHIKQRVEDHHAYSISYMKSNNLVDSQRQAWIAEGMLECINEPDHIIAYEDSLVTKFTRKVCELCGNINFLAKAKEVRKNKGDKQ